MAQTSMTGVSRARLDWEDLIACDRCVWPGMKLRDAKDMLELLEKNGYIGHISTEPMHTYCVSLGLKIGKVLYLKPEQREPGWLLTEWVKICPKCDKIFKEPRNNYYSPSLAEWELEDALHNAD